ncbi:MAG: hypothetical protein WB699_17555 [Bacteroidota bacterium]
MRSMITAFFFVWLCARPQSASSQTQDPHQAQPERPTVATHAGTVERGWLEIEAGGELDYYDDHSNGVGLPLTLKLGLGPAVQLSVFASAVRPQGTNTLQKGDLALGVKWRLADDLPVLGRFALLPAVKLPTGSTTTGAGTGTDDVSLLLISSHDLGPVALDINLGFTRRTGDGTEAPQNSTLWTISFGGPGIGELGWVAEVYGLPGTSGPAGKLPVVAALFGPTLEIQSFLVIDMGVIVPITGPQPHALYFGGVWNIGRVWE